MARATASASSTTDRRSREEPAGLTFERRWTTPGVDPYDEVAWATRTASIGNESGKVVFEQADVEVPESWSQLATNVVVSKYFRGHLGTPGRERSVRQLVSRVVDTICGWAVEGRYFATHEDLETFRAELTHLILHQRMAFNSPVWFNVGVEERPQCSACFINSVQDSMTSIMDLAKTEAMLFKYGSGAGSNLSPIRSAREKMAGGGIASGPVSFMKGYDAFAGVIKSGGKTRRAAKMVILDADHPDILDFINCKMLEEKKAWALIEAGYDASFTGEAYGSVFFQNANHSVRVTDDFMRAVERDGEWTTHFVTTREPADTFRAREIVRQISEAAWVCGDPGMQYDTTINDWNPVANSARQFATNPCSEFSFIDDTSCNLASLNLMKFVREDGEFDVDAYRYACRLTITAQEIIVDYASYPTPKIEENSHRFRPLGLGYANLGALLMSRGLAYDSPGGQAFAAALTSIMTAEAYRQSAVIARDHGGPFVEYEKNREPFLRVIAQAPRGSPAHPRGRRAGGRSRHGARAVGRDARPRRSVRLPQRAGHAARAHGHHRVHDGLRHHRHRARHRAGQVQEAGRRGLSQDRQPDRAGRAAHAWIRLAPGRGDRSLRQRARDDRGRAEPQAGAPAGLRLRVQAGQRRAFDPLHGPHPDDVGGPAVPVRRHQQDREHAGRRPRLRTSSRSTWRAGGSGSRRSPSTATTRSVRSR